jgi:hypothetical protein
MGKTNNTGLMAGAPPTSPGGMSQKALLAELVEKHGWTKAQAKPFSPLNMWADLIDAVVVERRHREAEAEQDHGEPDGTGIEVTDSFGTREVEYEMDPVAAAEQEADDLDDLLAEFELPHTLNPNDDLLTSCGKHDLPNCAECTEPAVFETVGAAMFDAATGTIEDIDPEALMAELAQTRHEEHEHAMQHGLLIKDPHTLDYVFNGHAGAGPSASERWLSCTASLGASREFLETLTPNQQETFARSNEAARQGTTAHAAAEVEARVILGEVTQEEADLTMLELAVLPDSDGEAYDEEMGEYITEYVDLVKSYVQDRGSENVLIEARVVAAVPLTDLHEGEVYEIPGSVDCGVLPTPEDPVLVSADLKYGNGIWVDVDENSQARIYALGMLALMVDPETGRLPEWLVDVTYHIIQPRMDGIKTRTESVDDLLDWRDQVLAPALTAALYGVGEGAEFKPSEGACQFCPARGGCAALAEERVISAASLFDTVVEAEFADGPGAFPETTSLTDTRLGELLAQISGLIDIHKDLKAEAERRLYRGDSVPGFQLVNYTPPRKWKPGADEQLDNAPVWTRKLITPTQAVKLAEVEKWDEEEKKILTDLIDTPDKRPVVAKEGDRRKPWTGRPPEAMFEDESESGEPCKVCLRSDCQGGCI